MSRDEKKQLVREKYGNLEPHLNEKTRRLWAASEAKGLGRGGISIVAEAIQTTRKTIRKGIRELRDEQTPRGTRQRRSGGGRLALTVHDQTLAQDFEALIEPTTKGDPERALRWTCKSLEHLVQALTGTGHTIGRMTVRKMLKQQGYSLQGNRKTREGTNHPDRNEQFEYINESVVAQQKKNQPCISVDTKKKENVGNYKNNGREWSKKKEPVEVNMHDFPNKELGKAAPYGVYDLLKNEGWVNVGITADTAQFAVESIRRWWQHMGRAHYPNATELLITADSGGSNSARSKLWKVTLQQLANELNMTIKVRHFPPGTSKWNKIEHRLFSMISKNWRGKPLDSLATIINLIGGTTTKTGLTVKAMIDENLYEKGIKVSDTEMAQVNLTRDARFPQWNYAVAPG